MEEFKPGYFIKYDGFRAQRKYTYITPSGSLDVETYEQAYGLAEEDKAVYGVKIDLKLPYPFKSNGSKWKISKVKNGKYAGLMVCVIVEWSDGWVLIETGTSSEEEESVLDFIRKEDIEC